MGDKVSFSNSMVVTIFSMVVVFLVLILIAYLIGLLRTMSSGKKVEINTEVVEDKAETIVETNDEELVAVIAAAVAASLGLNIPDINIKSIRRIPQNSLAWSDMGKKEQLLGKL